MALSDIRLQARNALSGKWLPSVLVTLLASILGGLIIGGAPQSAANFDLSFLTDLPTSVLLFIGIFLFVSSIITLVTFVIGGTIQVGYAQFLLKQIDRAENGVGDLFSQFYRFGRCFVTYFLVNLFIILWALLLIIPGIIKAYSYAMVPFIMAENPEIKPMDAIRASKEMMRGHKWKLFLLGLSFIGWALLSVLTLGIGYLFYTPYINMAYAVFYREVSRPQEVQPAA